MTASMKTALVTGSAKHVGKALSVMFAKLGMNVVINCKTDEETAEELSEEIRTLGADALVCVCDVTNYDACERMFSEINETFGGVDILVNNVGPFMQKRLFEYTPQEWKQLVDANLNSAFYCSKLAVNHMVAKGSGRIINIGAAGCDKVEAYEYVTPYYAAKTALTVLTKSMAKELAVEGITVNMICPGIMQDGVGTVRGNDLKRIPAGRFARYDDVVSAAEYLVSNAASYVTGNCLNVSGGWKI